MDNILAKIYSTGDSWRRAVVDVFTNPVDAVNRAASRMREDSDALQADIKTALPATNPGGKSVLAGKKEQAAAWAGIQPVIDNLMGMGIIVPVEAAYPKFTRSILQDIRDELDIDPRGVYDRYKIFRQPTSGRVVANISDAGQKIDSGALTASKTAMGKPNVFLKSKTTPMLGNILDLSRYPADLQSYMQALTVKGISGRGAFFNSQDAVIGLGSAADETQLTSNLLHEMQHAAQYLYDMPRGGNPQQFFSDYGRFSTAGLRAEQILEGMEKAGIRPQGLVAADMSQQGLRDPDTVNTILGMLKKVEKQAHSNYSNISGEVEARLVQELFETGTDDLPMDVIRGQMRVNPSQLIDPRSISQMPKVDADPVTQSIINILLGTP